MSRARYSAIDETLSIRVACHATERYAQRARRHGAAGRLASEIADAVRTDVELGLLFAAGDGTHLAPVAVPSGPAVCAVLEVRGPIEKPFAIIVYTVLTADMAAKTFGHLPGLISTLKVVPVGAK